MIKLFAKNPVIQGFYFYRPLKMVQVILLRHLFCLDSIETKNSSCDNFEINIYNYLTSQGDEINDEDLHRVIKENDKLGLVYHDEFKTTLDNFRKIYHGPSSSKTNGLMALVDSTDKLVIMRNQDGVAIYENEAHRKTVGDSIVGVNPELLKQSYPAYKTCLDVDQHVFNNGLLFYKSYEIFDGIKYESMRERMIYNGQNFIIVTVCPADSGIVDFRRDELTGCFDRSFIKMSGESFLGQAVAFLDLNGFKKINDIYGHHIGDMCLTKFAKILRSQLRASDLVVRYGGDEFLVIFDVNADEEINIRLDELNAKVEEEFSISGYHLSFSYGVSIVGDDGVVNAIYDADMKMYEAKKSMREKIA